MLGFGLKKSLVTLASLAVLGGGAALYFTGPEPTPPPAKVESRLEKVALYCQFYVFVESRPFVAFMLERAPAEPGHYVQAYVAKADGDTTDYNVMADRKPEWRLDPAGTPPRIEGRVTVPDPGPAGLAEQDIAIELREFDSAQADGVWREASLKSVYYQNLPGKCRQDVLRDPGQRAER